MDKIKIVKKPVLEHAADSLSGFELAVWVQQSKGKNKEYKFALKKNLLSNTRHIGQMWVTITKCVICPNRGFFDGVLSVYVSLKFRNPFNLQEEIRIDLLDEDDFAEIRDPKEKIDWEVGTYGNAKENGYCNRCSSNISPCPNENYCGHYTGYLIPKK